MRVIFAGGGTGGHVYPNIAVARSLEEEMRRRGERLELLYIGVRGRFDEAAVPAEGIEFRAIAAGPLRVASPLSFAANTARLLAGVAQSLRILLRFQPDAIFATGGYASAPVGLAACILRRPLVVYLPDVTPGWAVRLLSRLATRVTTTSDSAVGYLPKQKTIVTGYPVRAEFWSGDRADARTRFGVPPDAKLLLVTGASQGSHRINQAVSDTLLRLLERCYVLHVTGADDGASAVEQRKRLPNELRQRYTTRAYMPELAAAMLAADLVVSRSGASTLGELPAASAPSVLIPGEYEGWSQAPNAEYLQTRGAAVMLRNDDLDRFADVVLDLLGDDQRLERMRQASRSLARPEAAGDLARVLIEVARRPERSTA